MLIDQIVVGLIVGGGSASLAAYLTALFSLKRYRQEHWLTIRVAAYERLFEALHHVKRAYELDWEEVTRGREVSEATREAMDAEATAAYRELYKYVDTARFLLGEEAHQRLAQFKEKRDHAKDSLDWMGYLDSSLGAIEPCLKDLIDIAVRETGLQRRSRWVRWRARRRRS